MNNDMSHEYCFTNSLSLDVPLVLALLPAPHRAWAEKRQPDTHCLRKLGTPSIS